MSVRDLSELFEIIVAIKNCDDDAEKEKLQEKKLEFCERWILPLTKRLCEMKLMQNYSTHMPTIIRNHSRATKCTDVSTDVFEERVRKLIEDIRSSASALHLEERDTKVEHMLFKKYQRLLKFLKSCVLEIKNSKDENKSKFTQLEAPLDGQDPEVTDGGHRSTARTSNNESVVATSDRGRPTTRTSHSVVVPSSGRNRPKPRHGNSVAPARSGRSDSVAKIDNKATEIQSTHGAAVDYNYHCDDYCDQGVKGQKGPVFRPMPSKFYKA